MIINHKPKTMMAKKNLTPQWLLTLLSAMFVFLAFSACSSTEGDDNKGGGGYTPDPNIPVISDITYELSPQAVIVPEAVTTQLVSVDTIGHTLVLPSSAEMPQVGQCLIFNTPTDKLHDGLLAKVLSVEETGSGYKVTYADAELQDAFKDIDIPEQYIPLTQYVEHVYDGDGKEVRFTREADTRADGQKSFHIVIPEKGWSIGNFELTPKMTVDLSLRYVLMYGNYQIDYAGAKIDADVELGADLNFTIKEATLYETEIPLLTIYCAAIPVGPILLTPYIEVSGVFKIDGKLSLEASISYKRTLHAKIIYQTSAGLEAEGSIDPPAEDALKFTFGPKFEGGVGWGLRNSIGLGMYGKTFALRGNIDFVKKETISGKIDLVELADGNWSTMQWEDFMYNQSVAWQVGATLLIAGKNAKHFKVPEVSMPIDSRPILPPFTITKNEFAEVNESEVTLKMQMTSNSVLKSKFSAVFSKVSDKEDEHPVTANFDLDDEKWRMLESGTAVDITAKAKLEEGQRYRVAVKEESLGITWTAYEDEIVIDGSFTVSPNDLTYKWEGESQDVYIEKGGYEFCGADVPEAYAKWVSAVADNDGKVAIAVQPNLTFEERKATVECWVSTKSSPSASEKRIMTVAITQGPVEGVDWNPKELSFPAEGGSEKISFDFGGFTRFGAQVHEEGVGWCGVAAANGKLTITVQANPSTESRECIVDAYVTNSQNPAPEDMVIMPITIFQEAGDGQAAANNVKELWGTWTFTYSQHDWYVVYTVTFGKDGSYHYESVDYNHPEESFTRTGTYKVLSYEPWTPTSEGVVGLAEIEESFHNSLTGNDVVRQWTVRLYNNGQLGYENKLWRAQ